MAKISVFLDDQTHKAAKIAAMDAQPSLSLSQWVAVLIATQLAKHPPQDRAIKERFRKDRTPVQFQKSLVHSKKRPARA